jgi:hypothetical protein
VAVPSRGGGAPGPGRASGSWPGRDGPAGRARCGRRPPGGRRRHRRAARPGRPGPEVTAALAAELVPDETRGALDSLRTQVALALERADLAAELARRASVDPLTGLANRAAFSRRLREALSRLHH